MNQEVIAKEKAIEVLEILARAEPGYTETAKELGALSKAQDNEELLKEVAQDTLSFLSEENPQRAKAIEAITNAHCSHN